MRHVGAALIASVLVLGGGAALAEGTEEPGADLAPLERGDDLAPLEGGRDLAPIDLRLDLLDPRDDAGDDLAVRRSPRR